VHAFAVGIRLRLGLPPGAICIVGSVAAKCRLRRGQCLSAPAFPADLISGDMAGDKPEARCRRPRSSAGTGFGQLPDGLEFVAQVEVRHDQTGLRTAPPMD